ncbi:MAG TPA: type II toxin-antitoxin system RelE/ParE family toxin [Polyangiaceae bacterium]|nr:type II toxin-antitoxin system RelE/ParE family toxin [Polyangiaceae bacterium]
MAYRVEIKPKAKKQLADLPPADRKRVGKMIDDLRGEPRPHGVEKLKGEDDLYRVRSSDFRVVTRSMTASSTFAS